MPTTVGVSLKAYFGHARARAGWARSRNGSAGIPPSVRGGSRCSSSPRTCRSRLRSRSSPHPHPRRAQDVSAHGPGAFTGEVTAPSRRGRCGSRRGGSRWTPPALRETDTVVRPPAAKTAAVVAAGMMPVLCLGEPSRCGRRMPPPRSRTSSPTTSSPFPPVPSSSPRSGVGDRCPRAGAERTRSWSWPEPSPPRSPRCTSAPDPGSSTARRGARAAHAARRRGRRSLSSAGRSRTIVTAFAAVVDEAAVHAGGRG